MTQPTQAYFDVLKLAYKDEKFWRRLIAKPAHALDETGFPLTVEDREKLFSALNDFSLVLAFDKYKNPKPKNYKYGDEPQPDDGTGWDCTRVPWGQT